MHNAVVPANGWVIVITLVTPLQNLEVLPKLIIQIDRVNEYNVPPRYYICLFEVIFLWFKFKYENLNPWMQSGG